MNGTPPPGAARLGSEGRIVPLDRQDRALRDTRKIFEGVSVLGSALAAPAATQAEPARYASDSSAVAPSAAPP